MARTLIELNIKQAEIQRRGFTPTLTGADYTCVLTASNAANGRSITVYQAGAAGDIDVPIAGVIEYLTDPTLPAWRIQT